MEYRDWKEEGRKTERKNHVMLLGRFAGTILWQDVRALYTLGILPTARYVCMCACVRGRVTQAPHVRAPGPGRADGTCKGQRRGPGTEVFAGRDRPGGTGHPWGRKPTWGKIKDRPPFPRFPRKWEPLLHILWEPSCLCGVGGTTTPAPKLSATAMLVEDFFNMLIQLQKDLGALQVVLPVWLTESTVTKGLTACEGGRWSGK